MIRKNKVDPEVQEDLTRVTSFDAGLIASLATLGTPVNIPAGWSVIMQTTPADSAYIVLDGTVEIRKSGQVLATLGPGDVFGEIALVDHRLRSASVIASSPLRALRLEDEAVRELIEQDATFADTLRSTAKSRLAES